MIKQYRLPGIHVSEKEQPFASWIISGMKVIETRNRPTLDPYIGKRVGIIATGKGKARLIGYVTIDSKITYNSYSRYWIDSALHMVPGYSSYYWQQDKTTVKYGYVLRDVKRLKTPFILPSESYTGDRTARDLFGFVEVA